MRLLLQILLPVLVLLLGGSALYFLIALQPEASTVEQEVTLPLVRAMPVEHQTLQVQVKSQGNVQPRREIDLVPEVSGKVVRVSPSLIDGGFFEADETLLEIDPRDFQLAVTQQKAQVAEKQYRLKLEEAEAEAARREWKDLGKGAEPDPLVLREPQLAEARASLAAAQAMLEKASLDLERTNVKAPFAGRVRSEAVDIGQFITSGSPLARIYSVDIAEVRLPVPDVEVAYLDIPLRYRGDSSPTAGPDVRLTAEFAGKTYQWMGKIVRTDGQINSLTRQVTLIAAVADPYAHGEDRDQPPLTVGMFVEAEIVGKTFKNLIKLPRGAVQNSNRVLVVDADNRLRFRAVQILRRAEDSVLIRSGLENGELVCLSKLQGVTDGMQVQVEVAENEEK
ncbi:MAG: efflux RND transporter periplasmic adaptor subunit [Planctomycetota bacterium]|jgi:RND family efflux transporter MFP subunit